MSFGCTTTVTITLSRERMRSKTPTESTWLSKANHRLDNVATEIDSTEMPKRGEECHVKNSHQFLKHLLRLIGYFLLSCVNHIILLCRILRDFFDPLGELPALYYRPSVIHNYVLRNCLELSSEYRCTPWARTGWIQTLSNFLRKLFFYDISYRRKLLLMKDGGFVGIDWYHKFSSKRSSTRPILLIVPCRQFVSLNEDMISEQAYRSGFRPVVFRRRGSAGMDLSDTSKFQTFGDSSDLREVVKYIKQFDSRVKLFSLGVGSGAGLLLSYLGEYGSSCHLGAVVCLSPWYSLQDQLSCQPRQSFSQWLFLQSMKWELYQNAQVLQGKLDLDKYFGSSSPAEYLEHIYCSNEGSYEKMTDLFEKEEFLRDIDEVSIPVLCVNSLDDPIVKCKHIPFDLFEALPHVMLATTQTGGHGAFLEGWGAKNWGIGLALNYFQTLLEVMKKPELVYSNNNKRVDLQKTKV